MNGISEQLRMLHNEELHNLYRLRSIFTVVNSRKLHHVEWRISGRHVKFLGMKPLRLFRLAKRGDGRNFTRCFKKLMGDNIPLTYYQRIFNKRPITAVTPY